MAKHTRPFAVLWLLPLIAVVVGGSLLSVSLWGGKPEQLPDPRHLRLRADMTPRQIQKTNRIPARVVGRAFGLRRDADWDRPLSARSLTPEQARARLVRTLALAAESGSKNWRKILLKFALWFLALSGAFFLLRTRRLTPGRRRATYLGAVLLFGVALGADPSPMGTVKDAIVLWGHSRAIFPPRMIALGVFLLMVVIFNKSICAWGCQAGTLQDLVFRLNRDPRDRRGRLPQWRPPFWLTNSVRIAFFVAFTAVAVIWATDIVGPLDPFKIFKPAKLGWVGGLFVGALLLASLFTYRPWCHFFCPFGLVGWLFEKLSVFRIRVDYDTCIACEACHRACPSTVMEGILKRQRATLPDCFACGNCVEACPTGAVGLRAGRRPRPPGGWTTFRDRVKAERKASRS